VTPSNKAMKLTTLSPALGWDGGAASQLIASVESVGKVLKHLK